MFRVRTNIATGEQEIIPLTQEEIEAAQAATLAEAPVVLKTLAQDYLDQSARSWGYDSILSACTYADDPDPVFAAEGAAFKRLRSGVWRKCYEVQAAVLSGQRVVPTAAELFAEFPSLEISPV